MARKTVLVCDSCGTEVGESKGAIMRITFNDARRGAKQADLCDGCAGSMPGRLYDLGDYPGAISEAETSTRVIGEVVQLPSDSAFLKRIDDYEGYNPDSPATSLFIRETRSITLPDGTHLPCWVYLYNQDPASARLIPSGNYSHWHRDNRE